MQEIPSHSKLKAHPWVGAVKITGISKSIDMERLTSKRATLLGIGTWQYVKDVFYVNLSHNLRKVKVKGVYVDVINIYGNSCLH